MTTQASAVSTVPVSSASKAQYQLSIDERLTTLEATLAMGEMKPQDQDLTSRVDTLLSLTNVRFDELFSSNSTSQAETSNNGSNNSNSNSIGENNGTRKSTFEKDLAECERLSKVLDYSHLSGSLLLESSAGSSLDQAPNLYRKQEVLTRSDDLLRALNQLAKIRDLLLISNPTLVKQLQILHSQTKDNNNATKSISSPQEEEALFAAVGQAPIISSSNYAYASNPDNIQKLANLETEIQSVQTRSGQLVHRLDTLLEHYSKIILLVNERMVYLKEEYESNLLK